jgi:hypothetical protein
MLGGAHGRGLVGTLWSSSWWVGCLRRIMPRFIVGWLRRVNCSIVEVCKLQVSNYELCDV